MSTLRSLTTLEHQSYQWDSARELQVARRVRTRLLPSEPPRLQTLACDGLTVPAGGVGGDTYDFLAPRPGSLVLILGDISGHGIPAALMMANLQALLRGQYAFGSGDLQSRLDGVNRLFVESTGSEHFASLFLGEYDDVSRRLRYANCGHPPPLLLRADGGLERLEPTAMVIGAFPGWSSGRAEVELGAGDTLLLYSDGVTEAADPDRGFYGDERLAEVLRDSRGMDIPALAWRVVGDVRRHCRGRLDDDVTVVVARSVAAPAGGPDPGPPRRIACSSS